jgi:HlyD family secretion protein
LKFIAPKGLEEAGAVQFKIEGDVEVSDDVFIRAGYSANASIVLEKKENILVIPEALLQFDKSTNKPYVELAVGAEADQKFERKNIETGISDGVNVEILSGLTEEDNIKQWNKTEPIKKGEEEDAEGEETEE